MIKSRTIIIPASVQPNARALCKGLAGVAGDGMFVTGLSATGKAPATHYISSGPISHDMAALLKDDYGFGSRDVRVLTDAKATKAAVIDHLEELVSAAEAGRLEHLVFSYSSHGTQVPDTSGDEADRVDEALVAYDMAEAGDSWDLDTVVVDDELRRLPFANRGELENQDAPF